MMHVALVAAFIAAAFGAEPASPPAGQSIDNSSTAAQPAEKKVCRRILVTGSITPKRDCRTRTEWAAQAKADEESVRQMQDDQARTRGN